MVKENKICNVFEAFEITKPSKKNTTIEVLYEYEKHYMKTIREFKSEIDYIDKLLKDVRQEQIDFLENKLPKIKSVLDKDNIDDETQKIWLTEMIDNLNRSYRLSENLITNYLTKGIDEFKITIEEKIRNI